MRTFFLFLCSIITTASFAADIFSQTTHEIRINGKQIVYTATVASIPARDFSGKETGNIFYIAYRQQNDESPEKRPITFVFNGGPGSSSVWLHLGAFGPKRVLSPEEGQKSAPPYLCTNNTESILDLTDLVFIDPIGTGFSRASSHEKEESFYDMKGDIEAISSFICDFVTREGRWKSPKYVAGESYGTLRACGVSEHLLSRYGLYLNGLILISCAIDFQTFVFDLDNELTYSLYLPSYTAAAWYHGKLDHQMSLEETLNAARMFALDSFAPALIHYGSVPTRLYDDISYWTGLPVNVVQQQDGLIDDSTFFIQLLCDKKKVIGRFDSRCIGDILPPRDFSHYEDPSSCVDGAYTAAMHAYLWDDLNCKIDFPRYEIELDINWNYSCYGYPNMMDHLRKSLILNPDLKIFTACGYFDLATPFAAAEYCFKRLHLPLDIVTFGYYEGGHMFYTNPAALKKFKNDLIQFYSSQERR